MVKKSSVHIVAVLMTCCTTHANPISATISIESPSRTLYPGSEIPVTLVANIDLGDSQAGPLGEPGIYAFRGLIVASGPATQFLPQPGFAQTLYAALPSFSYEYHFSYGDYFSGTNLNQANILLDWGGMRKLGDGGVSGPRVELGTFMLGSSFYSFFAPLELRFEGWLAISDGTNLTRYVTGNNPMTESLESATLLVEIGECYTDLSTTNTNPGHPDYDSPDQIVDGQDLSYFIEKYQLGDLIADVSTTNRNPFEFGFGIPDGVVDGADLSYFVEAWMQGCWYWWYPNE